MMNVKINKITANNINWITNLSEESQKNVQLKLELMSKVIDLKQRIELIQYAIDNNRSSQDSLHYMEQVKQITLDQLKEIEKHLVETKKLIQSQYDLIDQLNKAKINLFE
ncbi:hypothetical protein [Solibacillus sp. CAU 1738]|uniref:hypothetical protein n=1 Tax=Solibacillus sp. CAU 1738 TaxID=3140363 RepID=UPI0032603A60